MIEDPLEFEAEEFPSVGSSLDCGLPVQSMIFFSRLRSKFNGLDWTDSGFNRLD
jgi:hypothetical protein